MYLTLPNGKEVKIAIKHDKETAEYAGKPVERRITNVWIKMDGKTYEGKAACAPCDQFTKLAGRRLAGLRALKGFSRSDKTAIFSRICPEYFRGRTPKTPPAKRTLSIADAG